MKKQLVKNAILFLLALGLSLPCAAQEILPTESAYGLWKLNDTAVDTLGNFEIAAVTFLPKDCILYLDGAPVEPYTPFTAQQLRRVLVFCTEQRPSIGVTTMQKDKSKKKQLRIRCINPVFLDIL